MYYICVLIHNSFYKYIYLGFSWNHRKLSNHFWVGNWTQRDNYYHDVIKNKSWEWTEIGESFESLEKESNRKKSYWNDWLYSHVEID